MGEEKKEEVKEENKKEEAPEEEKKVEEKKEEEPPLIVLKVDMHCEACARKVARALKGFEGVEEVTADSKASKVVVKGKALDPVKVSERLQKKSGKKVELISPLPKPPEEPKPEEKKEEPPKEEVKKEEPPQPITVVLNVRMHCEACALVLQRRIKKKIKGVDSVETDVANDKVTVKGILDPEKLASDIYKKTKKQASVVKEEEKKEEEKKEESKKEEAKKEEEKKEKKEEGEEGKEEDDKKAEIKRSEYWPSMSPMEYAYYPPPQMFSDENPNACAVM